MELAVLGDPVFDAEDPRVHKPAAGSEQRPAESPERTGEESALERAAVETGVLGKPGVRFPRLAFSRQEAEAIHTLVPQKVSLMALDFSASRDTITSERMRRCRRLHLATHSILNSEHPELSGVVLSLVDAQGRPRDGFLRLHEIYNLELPAELVVLSACQTALGKEMRGEGLIGLSRGFFYAGASRVVASLWKVDDEATSQLMRLFYGAMLGPRRMTPAAALRQAQLEVAKETRWQAPYFWAAFTLQGDWK
jgi:CHAT domain-containing protein